MGKKKSTLDPELQRIFARSRATTARLQQRGDARRRAARRQVLRARVQRVLIGTALVAAVWLLVGSLPVYGTALRVVLVVALLLAGVVRFLRNLDRQMHEEQLAQNALDEAWLDSPEARRRAELQQRDHWLKRS